MNAEPPASPAAAIPRWTARVVPSPILLLLLILISVAGAWQQLPPAPLALSAPPDAFSAARATDRLRDLLGDEQPHPAGSPANQAVRNRLVAQLEALGLTPEIQRAVGCNARYPVCGRVENVLAELPGASAQRVALLTHYDSVPYAPGAGDNGAGVATALEVARSLLLEGPARNPLLLLFTDAEEQGLLGAEAFFASHPLRNQVAAVVNLEGAGSGGGPVTLLRTANQPGALLDAFRRHAAYPNAQSMTQEVFARMQNDTDFSVAARAGIPAIDFAFGSEFSHYHTHLDNIDNLDQGTLQHHGENALPLLRALANTNLRKPTEGYVYQTVLGEWIVWRQSSGIWLALAAVALLLLSYARVRAWVTPLGVLGGVGRALLALLLGALFCTLALWLADRLAGTTPTFPAQPWPWRLLLYAAAIAAVLLAGQLLRRRAAGFWGAHLGLWLLISALGVWAALVLPLGANLFITPALAVGLTTLAVTFTTGASQPGGQWLLAAMGAAALALAFAALAPMLEASQGFTQAPIVFATLLVTALALLPARPRPWLLPAVAGVAAVALVWVAFAPLHSNWRPQPLNLLLVQNAEQRSARYAALSSYELPAALQATGGYQNHGEPLLPWRPDGPTPPQAATDYVDVNLGSIDTRQGQGTLELHYRPPLDVNQVQLVVPRAGLRRARADGVAIALPARDDPMIGLSFYQPGADGVTFELSYDSRPPGTRELEAYLVEVRRALPDSALAQQLARGDRAVPRHRGDRWLTWRPLDLRLPTTSTDQGRR